MPNPQRGEAFISSSQVPFTVTHYQAQSLQTDVSTAQPDKLQHSVPLPNIQLILSLLLAVLIQTNLMKPYILAHLCLTVYSELENKDRTQNVENCRLTIYFNFSNRAGPFSFYKHAPSMAGDHWRIGRRLS